MIKANFGILLFFGCNMVAFPIRDVFSKEDKRPFYDQIKEKCADNQDQKECSIIQDNVRVFSLIPVSNDKK